MEEKRRSEIVETEENDVAADYGIVLDNVPLGTIMSVGEQSQFNKEVDNPTSNHVQRSTEEKDPESIL